MSLLIAVLLAAAQETAPVSADAPAPEAAAKAEAKPEKICRRKVRSTGEGIVGLKSVKICKTKEDWDKAKSGQN